MKPTIDTAVVALRTVVVTLLLVGSGCTRTDEPNLKSIAGAVVTTESGTATGVGAGDGVVRWFDIPFAQPPVGELRWRAPQPLPASTAPIPRQSATVMCPQPAGQTSGITEGDYIGTEDCLYLDIYAPEGFSDRRYPVMFWVYGGGNTTGRKGTYDFSALVAAEDVVVVTVNYRLGPLGWFVHPALMAEAKGLDASGNFGTLDIIAALEWVNRNIGRFGGDPDNITVFGESAGGRNVYSLLVSPLTDNLFDKAIAQSPTVVSVTPEQAVNAQRADSQVDRGSWEVVEALGFSNTRVTAADLRAVPAKRLLETYFGLEHDHIEPQITADGRVIPEAGLLVSLGDPDVAKSVPVMVGSTRDEAALWLGLNRYFVSGDEVLFGLLPPKLRIRDPEKYRFWVSLRSRAWKLHGVDDPLQRLESAGYRQLYAYRFDWDEQADNWFFPFSELFGAVHASEIAFIQGAPMYGEIGEYMYPDTESARAMTQTMFTAWGSFARSGAPRVDASMDWPPYRSDAPNFMVLDVGDNLGPSQTRDSLEDVYAELAATTLLSPTEKCILAWEVATVVGQPDYDAYRGFADGACRDVDVRAEKAAIEAALVAEHGRATLP